MPTSSKGAQLGARAARIAGLLLLIASIPGCGRQPQIKSDHRELVLQLATAASTQDRGLLDRTADEIDGLAAEGKLDDGEKGAFGSIVAAARSGDWDQAQTLAYRLRDGQRPTDEDLERLANRTVRKAKTIKRGNPTPH